MDKVLDFIFKRRSIRAYKDTPLSEKDIKSLLEAGMASANASNRKPWHFVVVDDRAVLNELADTHPYGGMLRNAALAIAVCGDTAISDWWVQDCSASTENILLAATALGLGAVWIGCHNRIEREDAVRKVLKIPATVGVLSLISIGYPDETKRARTQYSEKKVHRNNW
ncbi:MAG: nitroreductase family protein [Spirochaetales bacterium]|nr:nitroreductase family protein [Spirochaetales bacterium]